jgi:hypothetical protein
MAADKPRANRERWNNSTDPHDAQRLEIEAKRHGLDPVTYEMSRAVPTDVVRSLVEDARSFQLQTRARWKPDEPAPRGPLEPVKLSTPYVNLVDRVADAFAAEDRAEALAKAQRLRRV